MVVVVVVVGHRKVAVLGVVEVGLIVDPGLVGDEPPECDSGTTTAPPFGAVEFLAGELDWEGVYDPAGGGEVAAVVGLGPGLVVATEVLLARTALGEKDGSPSVPPRTVDP
jgi:hypothetical protein